MFSSALRGAMPAAVARSSQSCAARSTTQSLAQAAQSLTQTRLSSSSNASSTMRNAASQLHLNGILPQAIGNHAPDTSNALTANSQPRTLSQAAFSQATQQLKLMDANAPHPRYAVSVCLNESGPSTNTQSPKLFNLKIRQSPFRKGLDTLDALELNPQKRAVRTDNPNKTADLTERLEQTFNTLSTPEEKSKLLNALEYQLLGPQAEIGSGKVVAPQSIAQLQYDCHRLLAEHNMSFSDLEAVINSLQSIRGKTQNASIQNIANAAAQAPWPKIPASNHLKLNDFKIAATNSHKA